MQEEANKERVEGTRIFFTGVGGQGTLLATRLVGEAALEEGLPVTVSEIHGMAQRGGVVESSVVMGDLESPTIADGEADILLAFEPLEALRALSKCHSRTRVVTNPVSVIPFSVATGKARYPSLEDILDSMRGKVASVFPLDASKAAREAGTERAANVVMVGALAGMSLLPIGDGSWRKALEKIVPRRFLEVNLEAFSRGLQAGSGAE